MTIEIVQNQQWSVDVDKEGVGPTARSIGNDVDGAAVQA